MNYVLISGVVRNLKKTKIYEDLVFTDGNKKTIGMASIAAAVAGEATSSSILSISSGETEVDMEYYTCSVNEINITGRFHKVLFQDGDIIDFIVIMKDGFAESFAARNRSRRLIWTLPYQTRGHIAQRWNNVSASLVISTVSALVASLFAIYNTSRPLAESWKDIRDFAVMGFFIMLIVNALARRPFYPFAREATKIFEVFGFEKPEMVDLQKNHDSADKEYYEEVGQSRPWEIIPWQYRYK